MKSIIISVKLFIVVMRVTLLALILICLFNIFSAEALSLKDIEINGNGIVQYKTWGLGIPGIIEGNESVTSLAQASHEFHSAYLANLNFYKKQDNFSVKLTLQAENDNLCSGYTTRSNIKSKLAARYEEGNFFCQVTDLGRVTSGQGLLLSGLAAEGTWLNYSPGSFDLDFKWLAFGYTLDEDVTLTRLSNDYFGLSLVQHSFHSNSADDPLNCASQSIADFDFQLPLGSFLTWYGEAAIARNLGPDIGTSPMYSAYLSGVRGEFSDPDLTFSIETRKYGDHFNGYLYYSTNEATYRSTAIRLESPYKTLEDEGRSINDFYNYASFSINEVSGVYAKLVYKRNFIGNTFVKIKAENLSLCAPGKCKNYFTDELSVNFPLQTNAMFQIALSNWRFNLTDITPSHYLALRGIFSY